MQYRTFGRLGWQVSEVGYGMWGMGGDWKGSTDEEALNALNRAIELGCNFFDTAWIYGKGHSERLFRELWQQHRDKQLYVATKIPPKNFTWPSRREFTLDECFPPEHIRKYTERSLENLGVERIHLQQFHVWEDSWAHDERWQRAIDDLKREGLIEGVGISVNRWEPENVLETLRTGLIDAVQVIYNIFDQAPEDELFPLTQAMNIAIIARVPFDEGTLTGKLTKDTKFAEDDWRATYFVPENLHAAVDRAEALRPLIPEGMSMAQFALRFILHHPAVSTVIPGMRRVAHVEDNIAASDGRALPQEVIDQLRAHRWDRRPTEWSQ
ncbi:MAG: aldo/keto reductase [Phototrophicales bacterium]|nr:MAG: aldo/keto reductase [Phototrophicales bacterium]